MKKSLKKLSLHRETLSALDNQPLSHVNGGATDVQTFCSGTSCENGSCFGTCSCVNTCLC